MALILLCWVKHNTSTVWWSENLKTSVPCKVTWATTVISEIQSSSDNIMFSKSSSNNKHSMAAMNCFWVVQFCYKFASFLRDILIFYHTDQKCEIFHFLLVGLSHDGENIQYKHRVIKTEAKTGLSTAIAVLLWATTTTNVSPLDKESKEMGEKLKEVFSGKATSKKSFTWNQMVDDVADDEVDDQDHIRVWTNIQNKCNGVSAESYIKHLCWHWVMLLCNHPYRTLKSGTLLLKTEHYLTSIIMY